MRSISELYGACHRPKNGILLGKGPSLDRFKRNLPESGAWPILGINHAALAYSNIVHLAISIDWIGQHGLGFNALRRPTGIIRQKKNLAPGERVDWTFTFGEEVPGELKVSTTATALHIMGQMGIRKVLMVGCDSYDNGDLVELAECCKQWEVPKLCLRKGRYRHANAAIDVALEANGIEAEWFHRGLE